MIAAVIINFHSEEKTISFVRNELGKVKCPLKVIIVDNDSSENSFAALSMALPDAVVLPSPDNLGFAKANNLGAEYARAHFNPEYILFANNDIRFEDSNVVDSMVEKISLINEAGVIGPAVIGLDGKNQSPQPFISFWDRHIWIYWSNLFLSARAKEERFAYMHPADAPEGFTYIVSGCFFLVKAADYQRCGGMDPATFLYAEEMILSERMKSIGKRCYYYPSVRVVHEHGATTTKYYNQVKIREMKFDSDLYYYKHYIGVPSCQVLLARFTYFLKRLTRH